MPMNGPPPSGASSDTNSYYYLANIVVETNPVLQNFTGGAPGGAISNGPNVSLNGAPESPFQMGGCHGCHGFQGQLLGGDMSVILAEAPTGTSSAAASIDTTPEGALQLYLASTRRTNPR
jgi:hypothetical protein